MFDPAYTTPWPRINVGVFIPQISRAVDIVAFVLDTGAQVSSLSVADGLHTVGISAGALADPNRWPIKANTTGVGGSSMRYIVPAFCVFTHDDGATVSHPLDLLLTPPDPTNNGIPSLLGWDALQHFSVNLNWSARQISLD